MERKIPLWFLLFCLISWAMISIVFGFAVKNTVEGSDRTGIFGKAAVAIADFPMTTYQVLRDLAGSALSGDEDRFLSVVREADDDYAGFEPSPSIAEHNIRDLVFRADRAKMADGWRALVGAFQVDGRIENAVLLLDPDLNVARKWVLGEEPVDDLQLQPDYRKFVHGIEILKDGSLIFTFDGSISLQRVDACGERQWVTGGKFHHAVTLDAAGETVWTFRDNKVAQVAVGDGALLREISMDDVIAKNPSIDILEIRRKHADTVGVNGRNTEGRWLPDRLHFNDVDPLPAALADRFPGFEAGDLLLSARSLNLVFILDPDTLEIKWWRIGAVQRQHDPDWATNGEIMVLNNRMSRDFSEIVSIAPASFATTVAFDGRKNDFYTRIRGKHQRLDDGTLVISSPQQGRAFEVDPAGDVVFEVYNLKPDSKTTNYVISELRWLPRDFFDVETWQCPPNN